MFKKKHFFETIYFKAQYLSPYSSSEPSPVLLFERKALKKRHLLAHADGSQEDFAAAAGACQIFSKVSALVYLPKLNQTKVNPARYSRKSAPSYIY